MSEPRTRTKYAYDNLSRLLSVLHQNGSTTLDGASYTVDNAGNRTAKTDQYANVTSNYTYDPIYELTQVTQAATTESYTYDAVGNRLSSLGVSPYNVNTSNELTSTPSTSYTYDSNGNTLTSVTGSNTTSYTWDFENRLTQVTLPGSGGTVSFKYDPFGRRIYKSTSSATSVYAYDWDNLIEETNSSGTVVARYAQTENVDEPLAMLRSSTTSYYEADGLGSVTSLSNTAGALAQTYTFDSFGKQTASSGSLTNPFQYTAREFDPETSLYYYRARYYDPNSGRFFAEDPPKFWGGDINLYRYVWDHPTSLRDPRGLWGAGVFGTAGAFGGVGEKGSAGATGTVGGVYLSDPSAPLGFTSAGYLSLGAFGGDHGVFGTPGSCSSVGGNRGAGVGAGVGAGFVVTNANSVNDFSGTFDNTTLLLPFIAIDLGEGSNGVKTLSVAAGPGWGLGIFHYTTNTYTNPVTPASFQCGCDKQANGLPWPPR